MDLTRDSTVTEICIFYHQEFEIHSLTEVEIKSMVSYRDDCSFSKAHLSL